MTTNTAPQSDSGYQNFELINVRKVMNFTYTWNIKHFGCKKALGRYCHDSPIFSNETDHEIKWRLRIENQFKERNCYVRLCFISSNVKEIQSKCKFSISNSLDAPFYQVKYYAKNIQFMPEKFSTCITESESVIADIAESGYRRSYIPAISLKIDCLINVLEITTKLTIPRCNLADNFKLMFENRKHHSDVILCVSGKEFQAHKAVLAARSPVFNAMFEHDMEEKKNNRVDIIDIDAEVFEEFLRFIYTGKVSYMEKFASDLLEAAEKYGFEDLKVHCGKALISNISRENAAEVLVLTDRYNLDQFKAAVRGYIGTYIDDVVCKTTEWKLMEKSHPHLISEVLCDVSKHLRNRIIYYESLNDSQTM